MVWNADITYIRILYGFVYLAALIDGFSRYIGGYALGKTLLPMLTIAALNEQYQKEIQIILFIIQTRAFSIAILIMWIF